MKLSRKSYLGTTLRPVWRCSHQSCVVLPQDDQAIHLDQGHPRPTLVSPCCICTYSPPEKNYGRAKKFSWLLFTQIQSVMKFRYSL